MKKVKNNELMSFILEIETTFKFQSSICVSCTATAPARFLMYTLHTLQSRSRLQFKDWMRRKTKPVNSIPLQISSNKHNWLKIVIAISYCTKQTKCHSFPNNLNYKYSANNFFFHKALCGKHSFLIAQNRKSSLK